MLRGRSRKRSCICVTAAVAHRSSRGAGRNPRSVWGSRVSCTGVSGRRSHVRAPSSPQRQSATAPWRSRRKRSQRSFRPSPSSRARRRDDLEARQEEDGRETATQPQAATAPPGEPCRSDRRRGPARGEPLGAQHRRGPAEIDRTPGGVDVVPDTAYKGVDARHHRKGCARLRAGRVRAAEVGRGHAAVDPRLGAVAQFPSARRAALHGRHPDQHRRRRRRLPGDRSDRLPLRRGLQGRQRPALRLQLAGRRHQLRDADGLRRRPVRRARRRRQLRLAQDGGVVGRRVRRPPTTSSPALGKSTTAFAITAGRRERPRQRQRRLSPNGGHGDALLSQRQLGAPAHTRSRDQAGSAVEPGRCIRADRAGGSGSAIQRRPTTSSATSTRCAFANKTTIRVAPGTLLEVGGLTLDRHLMHPIFRCLDYKYDDYGGFARLSTTAGSGATATASCRRQPHNGTVDARQYEKVLGPASNALSWTRPEIGEHRGLCRELVLFVPRRGAGSGAQYLQAARKVQEIFTRWRPVGDADFDFWSPKGGCCGTSPELAGVRQHLAQCRSADVRRDHTQPDGDYRAGATSNDLRDRHARQRRRFTWDLSVYRAEIDDEFQCVTIVALPTPAQRPMPTAPSTRASRPGAARGRGVAVWAHAHTGKERSGSTLRIPSATSVSTTTRCSATTSCPVRRGTS